MNTVLYTCITDRRDGVPPLPFLSKHLDYILYIDRDELGAVDPGPWIVRPLEWQHPTDPVRTARWHKHNPMLCFPHRTSSIWMDASHWPTTDISWFPQWFLQTADVACFPHFARTSIEQEAEEILRIGADDPDLVRAQLTRYQAEGFRGLHDEQLYETGIMVRRHGPQIRQLSELWWSEIENGSRRDQLSFTYCLWKLNMRCERLVPGYARHPTNPYREKASPYFSAKLHPIKKWVKPPV